MLRSYRLCLSAFLIVDSIFFLAMKFLIIFWLVFDLVYGTASFAAMAPRDGIPFAVVVIDAQNKTALELVRVTIRRGKAMVGAKATDISGRARFDDITPGPYQIYVHRVGYHDAADSMTVDAKHTVDTIALSEIGMQAIEVESTHEPVISAVDVTTGNQVFESEGYHAAPAAKMSDLIQQNVMGAARAPTGEVHVRGQHGEFTYYVDGIPIPLGVFGGLNEVVDPKVIDRATFMTGGFPAEYGGQMAAIVDVQNRVPSGNYHLDASTFLGSYFVTGNSGDSLGSRVGALRSINSNGQSLALSDHVGNLGVFVSGSRQETDRRIDPPTATLYHDHGFDYFLYGKLDYLAGEKDYFTMNLNYGRTATQIPFDSAETGPMDDYQTITNAFQTLSYFHTFSDENEHQSHLFIGGYAREGALIHTPGAIDAPSFLFQGDTTLYNLAEDRSFTTIGVRTKYDIRLSHQFSYAVGMNLSSTTGVENFTSANRTGASGPQVLTNFAGSDFGFFVQTEYHPVEWTSVDAGWRFDQHIAPDIPLTSQVSPRVRWNFFIDESNSGYVYVARMFMPTNIEGLRSLTHNIDTSAVGTLPERDLFYEASFQHRFDFGLSSKFAAFFKHSTPGVDDQTVGSSAVKTPVNIATVNTEGIEMGLTFSDPSTPFSGSLNTALTHAYGMGIISGGFLSLTDAGNGIDLDHDQRVSIVAAIDYRPQSWFANLTATYGSGLANGAQGVTYGNGLFDFNQAAHTTPSWILNTSVGHTFTLNSGITIEPSLYITNLLDYEHLIKGAYFSGASWEERRNVVFKIAVHV